MIDPVFFRKRVTTLASITTLTNGTTANAPDVMASLNSLNTNGVANDGGLITTSGAGILQPVGVSAGASGLTSSGPVTVNGLLLLYNPGSVQSIGNNATITLPGAWIRVTSSSNVTGVILTAGSIAGQLIFMYNEGSNSITFAAFGSNVQRGSLVVMDAGRLAPFLWNGTSWGEATY